MHIATGHAFDMVHTMSLPRAESSLSGGARVKTKPPISAARRNLFACPLCGQLVEWHQLHGIACEECWRGPVKLKPESR